MAHLAMHDALNVIDRRYESYAMGGREVPTASPAAAVAVAAHDVLVSTFEALPAELAFNESAAIDIVNVAEAQGARRRPRRRGEAAGHEHRRSGGADDARCAHRRPLERRTVPRQGVRGAPGAGSVPVRRSRGSERRFCLRSEVG